MTRWRRRSTECAFWSSVPEGLMISEAPLTYLGDKQINFQLPFEAAGMGLVRIAVDNSGARSTMQSIPVTNAAPGISPTAVVGRL